MTAITDILVNQKLSELSDSSKLQLSTSQKTQFSSSSISFEEMLSSFKTENRSEPIETVQNKDFLQEKAVTSPENGKSSEITDEKAASTSSEEKDQSVSSAESEKSQETQKASDEKETSENQEISENDEKKSVKKLSESKEISENTKMNNVSEENGPSIKTDKNLETNQSEKTEKKSKTASKDSKLNKDFARLDEYFDKNSADETALIQDVSNVEELAKSQKTKVNSQKAGENEKSNDGEFDLQTGEKSSDQIFDISGKNVLADENPKISKFDSDGKITVKDFRKELTEENEKSENSGNNQPKLKSEVHFENSSTANITMDVANNAQNDVLSLNGQNAASEGSTFQAMLNNQIQSQTPEIVKTGSIILKDNDKGTINLILHPDDLGNVKIHLSMDGKVVHGHITVNSKEALQVFKDNAQTLREAFIKNGFDAANFDVAYNNSSSGQNQEFNQNFNEEQFTGKKVYGNYALETSDSGTNGNFVENENFSKYSINIVA